MWLRKVVWTGEENRFGINHNYDLCEVPVSGNWQNYIILNMVIVWNVQELNWYQTCDYVWASRNWKTLKKKKNYRFVMIMWRFARELKVKVSAAWCEMYMNGWECPGTGKTKLVPNIIILLLCEGVQNWKNYIVSNMRFSEGRPIHVQELDKNGIKHVITVWVYGCRNWKNYTDQYRKLNDCGSMSGKKTIYIKGAWHEKILKIYLAKSCR